MLLKLSPHVHRQAQRLCWSNPSLIEDAFAEGRLRVWELLERGIKDEGYLLKSSANRIRNFLAHERYEPRARGASQRAGEAPAGDPLESVADTGRSFDEALSRVWVASLSGSLRSALEKELFTRDAKTEAERVALHRFRKSAAARQLARELTAA